MTRDTPKMPLDEVIDILKSLVFGSFDRTTAKEREALDQAISALQEQEELYVDSKCKTCRYYHDYDDVRCMICDDENDMYEAQEANNSNESSLTQKGLDTVSRKE